MLSFLAATSLFEQCSALISFVRRQPPPHLDYTSPATMPKSADSTGTALQICFGVLGIIGVVAAIASISYETSLGALVYRRLRGIPGRGLCLS